MDPNSNTPVTKPPPIDKEEAQKQRDYERAVHAELGGIADRAHRLFQWAVTLLLSFQTALFFVRKERVDLNHGAQLPVTLYFFGTTGLLIFALLFSFLSWQMWAFYERRNNTLPEVNLLGVKRERPKRRIWWILVFVYFLFPFLDAVGYILTGGFNPPRPVSVLAIQAHASLPTDYSVPAGYVAVATYLRTAPKADGLPESMSQLYGVRDSKADAVPKQLTVDHVRYRLVGWSIFPAP